MQVGILSNNQWPAPFDGSMYSNSGRNLKTWWNFEDFIGGASGNGQGFGVWKGYVGGAGAIIQDDNSATALRPGIAILGTGTTAAGYANLFTGYSANTQVLFGGGIYTFETDIYIPILSTVAEEYILRVGFGDATAADFVDGCYFEYDRLSGSDWQSATASNSARSKAALGTNVLAATWTRLKIIVAPNGSQVSFYVNNILLNTVGTNIPTGAGRGCDHHFQIIKSAGLTARTLLIDWAWLHFDLTASR